MRSGKVVPLRSINQGGKENGCERQSLETAPREAERGKREGKSSAENWREAGPRARPPRASRSGESPAETRRPRLGQDRALNPTGSQHRPHPHLNVPRVSSLHVHREDPCTRPLQEPVSAHAHMLFAHVITHLLLAFTTAGARGGGRPAACWSRLLSAILLLRVCFLHAVLLPGSPITHCPRPQAPLVLCLLPTGRGLQCSRPDFSFSCPVTRDANLPKLGPPWVGTRAQVLDHPTPRETGTGVVQHRMRDEGEERGVSPLLCVLETPGSECRKLCRETANPWKPLRRPWRFARLCTLVTCRSKNVKRSGEKMDSACGLHFAPKSNVFPTAF